MGLRDRINQSPGFTFGAAAALVLIALVVLGVQVFGNRRTFADKLPDAYFTTDDGKTFFDANSQNVAPFDYEGKTALRAYVYECGGERFVAYVERFIPDAHKAMVSGTATPQHQMFGRELKRPGDTKWVKSGDEVGSSAVMVPRCPHGGAHTPEAVEP